MLWLSCVLALGIVLPTVGRASSFADSAPVVVGADDAVDAVAQAPSAPYTDEGDRYEIADAPMLGAADALVTIVIFSGFQCSFCSRVQGTLREIQDTYGDDVRFVYKNLPLPIHGRGVPAARAALAAHQQGRFWEMHDVMMQNQRSLTDDNFVLWAERLGLDFGQFVRDYRSQSVERQVQRDVELTRELGISGTPNFFVNGLNVRGAQQFAVFAAAIDAELAAMQAAINRGQTRQEALTARIEANQGTAAPAAERRPQVPPTPDPEDELYLPVGDSPVLGADDALVTWVVFSEFQCPFCGRLQPTIDELRREFGGDLRIVFKHNPLSFHDRAATAAKAAIAAQNQGRFWEFHDIAFEHQEELTDENIVKWAHRLGLDLAQFRRDMSSNETAARIDEDQALALRVYARGTPHSFINGYRVRGAQPTQAFRGLIERELATARQLVAQGVPRRSVYARLQADANRGDARVMVPEVEAPAPTPSVVEIPIGADVPTLGMRDARVTLVVYTDWQCPFCARFAQNLDEALEGYTAEQVRVAVKQFPLPFHQYAALASQASLAAHAQGRFWEYHDLLWRNQHALERADLERYAREVGLDMAQFVRALDAGTYEPQVAAEAREGQGFGVRGTPTWFVNGVEYEGAHPAEVIRARIDAALEAVE